MKRSRVRGREDHVPSLSARRVAIAIVLSTTALAAWWWLRPATALELPARDRNVLLITIDTLRADALGHAGGAAVTPNLDRLAGEGRFDFAHAHSVVTLPSHASILTGLYPFAHGVRDNSGYRLPPDTPTLATRLRASGYSTGAFVGAFPLDRKFGLAAGFDVYDDRYPTGARPSELLMPERRADAVVDAATRWVKEQQRRWFAWVHVFDPHAPYAPPEPFLSQYRSNPYAGEVAWVDHALGPLLDLARSGDRPTLVIVTADHGEALGAHGEATHGLFAYEETLRVPLIVAATDWRPGESRRGDGLIARPSRAHARHIDILPTVLDALGMEPPGGLPGRSLRPGGVVGRDEGAETASYFEALTASLNRGWAPLTGVIVGGEKYIDLPIPELYDLAGDAGEARNRHGERPERARALRARLDTLRQGAVARERAPEDAETRRRLEALGYVSAGAPTARRYTEEDDPKRLVALDQAVQRGVELFQAGDVAGARQVYEETIRRRPTMATPYLHLAFLWWESGEPGRAIDTLAAGLGAGAVGAELQSQLGIYLAEAGPPGEAIRVLDAALASDPDDLDALNGMGIALFRSGRPADAERTFRSVLSRDATDAAAWQNLGTLALSTGQLAAARDAFTRALTHDPDLVAALNGLGVVESRSGHTQAAIDAWRRAVALDPRHVDALYNLGSSLFKAGQREAARPFLQQFAGTAPAAFYAEDLARAREWLRVPN